MFFALIGVVPKVNGITFGNNGRNFLNLCCQFVKTSRRERENVPRKDNLFYTNVHAALHERSRRTIYTSAGGYTYICGNHQFFVHVQKHKFLCKKDKDVF